MKERWIFTRKKKKKDVITKITANGDCSHEIKRCLLLGSKVMTNIDSILKSRDMRKVKDGGRIGWGNHFLPHIFIERSSEH